MPSGKLKRILRISSESSKTITSKARQKISSAKDDPRLLALLLVEFILTIILVAAIALYLDGRFNQVESPFNLIIFAAIVLGVLHFYRYTESFRFVRGMKRRSTFKTFALEFIIFMVVIVSAYIYQDPNTNTLQYPLNLLLFLAVLAIPAYFYIKEKFLQ